MLPEDWERLRALRLHALADAPLAFGSTLAREQAFADDVWQERAAGGKDRVTFIAEREGEWLGSATVLLEPEGHGERPAWIVGMWVHPAARRQGVARELLQAGAAWAREQYADVLNLHVTETNQPAIALYERLGFRMTGATEPLPHTPTLRELHMACPLVQFPHAASAAN